MPQINVITRSEKAAAIESPKRRRAPTSELRFPPGGGIYAIYLSTPGLLIPFPEGQDGLVYIGRSARLADRELKQHFSSGGTGFSTLRRSLGALLKNQLNLTAVPRGIGASEVNLRNYRFAPDGEQRLTEWMLKHLKIGIHSSSNHLRLEEYMVAELTPLLNLTKWQNPYRADIKCLRKECVNEARSSRNLP